MYSTAQRHLEHERIDVILQNKLTIENEDDLMKPPQPPAVNNMVTTKDVVVVEPIIEQIPKAEIETENHVIEAIPAVEEAAAEIIKTDTKKVDEVKNKENHGTAKGVVKSQTIATAKV